MYPAVHARETPGKPAYIMARTGQIVTYQELDDRSNQCARLFRSLGLVPGDCVALCMENHPRFLEICWAAQRSGLYYSAISTKLNPAEVEYIVDDCGAKVFITSKAMGEVAAGLEGRNPAVGTRLMVDATAPGYESYEEAVGAQPAEPIPDELEGADMLYSSGTTGRPKGVKVPLPNKPAGTPPALQLVVQGLYKADRNAIYLSPAPLYHAAPLRFNLSIQRLGGTCVVMDKFDALEALQLIERYRATHSQWVPTMFVRMLKLPEEERARYDVSSLQVAIHAAAPCPIPVKEKMIEWWGPVLHEYYAGTEGNGFCAIDSEQWLTHKGSVGRALQGRIHILDEAGEELPSGRIGTVYFSEGAQFEYHNDPEKTAASRSKQGYTTLGDVGYLDEEGYLYLTDRQSFMIISGGVNIYPQETENLLVTHPKVADAAVIGVPNEEFGEEVKAVVQPMDMADAGPALGQELIEFCRANLSHVKCPRSVDFDPELPRTPTGKLFKRLLRERYWKDRESRIL